MTRIDKLVLAVLLLCLLEACVPIIGPADVASGASTKLNTAITPLGLHETVAVLGPTAPDQNFPACVTDALGESEPPARFVTLKQFPEAVGARVFGAVDQDNSAAVGVGVFATLPAAPP